MGNIPANHNSQELAAMVTSKLPGVGIKDCWNYAHEGDGLTLYLDYTLFESGYLSHDESQFRKRIFFKSALFKKVPDMVEKIINEVVNKGGKVVFTNYNILKEYDGIALKLRYPA